MSPSSKVIGYPPAVARAILLTEYFFLDAAQQPASEKTVRRRFTDRIVKNRKLVPYPVFTLSSSTLDEFIEESATDGFIAVNGRIGLTEIGRTRLQTLRPSAERLLRRR